MVTGIDVGNSTIKVARVTDGVVGSVSRIATASHPDTSALRAALEGAAGPLVLVSVVPRWTATIRQLAAALGLALIEADAGTIPLQAAIPDPERVGADRLLGAWTACELFGSPVIVVDIGTATTIDVVDGDGAFAGGAIMPGPELAIRALSRDTALLPTTLPRLPERVIGRDTVEAIQSGAVLGHLVAIGGLLALMTDELGGDDRAKVVLTGGGSTALGSIEGVDLVEPDLLLRGLGMLAERLVVRR